MCTAPESPVSQLGSAMLKPSSPDLTNPTEDPGNFEWARRQIPSRSIVTVATEEDLDGFLETYTFVGQLGDGGQGQVVLYEANDEPGSFCAVKVSELKHDNSAIAREKVAQALKLYSTLYSSASRTITKGLVVAYSVLLIPSETKNKFTFVDFMPYAPGAGLFSYVTKQYPTGVPEADLKRIIANLLVPLNYLEIKSIVHRDLKPDNVKIDPSSARCYLLDFGMAASNGFAPHVHGGTMLYAAPEYLRASVEDKFLTANTKEDVYALGVLVHWMWAPQAKHARYGSTYPETPEQAVQLLDECGNTVKWPADRPPSDWVRELVDNCMQQDRCKRWSLYSILRHFSRRDLEQYADEAADQPDHQADLKMLFKWRKEAQKASSKYKKLIKKLNQAPEQPAECMQDNQKYVQQSMVPELSIAVDDSSEVYEAPDCIEKLSPSSSSASSQSSGATSPTSTKGDAHNITSPSSNGCSETVPAGSSCSTSQDTASKPNSEGVSSTASCLSTKGQSSASISHNILMGQDRWQVVQQELAALKGLTKRTQTLASALITMDTSYLGRLLTMVTCDVPVSVELALRK